MNWLIILRDNAFRVFAISIICCLSLATIVHLYLLDAAENAVGRATQYDIDWTGANGRVEVAQFEKYVARYSALGEKADANSVELFYDIVRSRMMTWGLGGFRSFLESSPERLALFEDLRARIEGLATDIQRLNEPDAQRRILTVLSETAPIIERISAEAHTTSVEETTAIREDLLYQKQLHRWIIIALLASGAMVLTFTALQNRSLRVAHDAAANHAAELLFLARHDALTKLPNRFAFESAYKAALTSKEGSEQILAAAIDIDGFKSVNDLLGHAAGDAVLVAFARLLAGEASRADPRNIVCRIGGDEFLALLWISDNPVSSMEFADRVLIALEHPLETPFGEIMINASIGIATSEGTGTEDLIIKADLALTEAKVMGKGAALCFDDEMLVGLKRRLRLEADLATAIRRGEIIPYYQPKVDLTSARLIGLEALARWHHPELGWIPPSEFIPIAENSGAIVKIGRLMLDTACRNGATISADVSIAVNLSIVQILKDDILETVKTVLAGTGLPPERLTLEITETVMMSDPEKVLNALKQLKMLGVGISLDDFGTGYSALAYLTRFRWDELKIDRSFIKGALCDPMNLTIIKTIKMLAEEMNAKLTIEGVETQEQHELLLRIGCDTVQGYLFGTPVPFNELKPLLFGDLIVTMAESDANVAQSEPCPNHAISIA